MVILDRRGIISVQSKQVGLVAKGGALSCEEVTSASMPHIGGSIALGFDLACQDVGNQQSHQSEHSKTYLRDQGLPSCQQRSDPISLSCECIAKKIRGDNIVQTDKEGEPSAFVGLQASSTERVRQWVVRVVYEDSALPLYGSQTQAQPDSDLSPFVCNRTER